MEPSVQKQRGEKRHRAQTGRGWSRAVMGSASSPCCHGSPCQEGIGAQPRHKLVLGLSQIRGRCRYRDHRAPWMFGMAPFPAPRRVRLQEQPPRPQDWKETQLSGCYQSPRGDAASQRRKNKAGGVAQHKSR